ncbi:MAG: translation initiation factor IF-2 N-terminal domain-containing protein [Caldilineaceae bacterium]|nr:translation initiation factor IF-2 N-terminal domain-containing protein [Caldilineaceae bacterium]
MATKNRTQQKARPGQHKGNNGMNGAKNAKRPNGQGPRPKAANEAAKKPLPTEVIVGDYITVRDLATLMNRSPIDLIKVLMQFGIMAPITHNIDHDTAVIIGEELGSALPGRKLRSPTKRKKRTRTCPRAAKRWWTKYWKANRKIIWCCVRQWWRCWAMWITAKPRCSTASATPTW